MPDREKVITGLELCTNISPDGCLTRCPYKDEKDETYSGFCEQVLKRDTLALLKEHEAVEPKVSSAEQRCGNCNKVIEMDGWQSCPWCGKRIDWKGWWKKNGTHNQDT